MNRSARWLFAAILMTGALFGAMLSAWFGSGYVMTATGVGAFGCLIAAIITAPRRTK
jgi:hypothetical protein